MTSPLAPAYDATSLGALLPGVAASLGPAVSMPAVTLPPAERVCVVLIDGLGDQLLSENALDAPFLVSLHR